MVNNIMIAGSNNATMPYAHIQSMTSVKGTGTNYVQTISGTVNFGFFDTSYGIFLSTSLDRSWIADIPQSTSNIDRRSYILSQTIFLNKGTWFSSDAKYESFFTVVYTMTDYTGGVANSEVFTYRMYDTWDANFIKRSSTSISGTLTFTIPSGYSMYYFASTYQIHSLFGE